MKRIARLVAFATSACRWLLAVAADDGCASSSQRAAHGHPACLSEVQSAGVLGGHGPGGRTHIW